MTTTGLSFLLSDNNVQNVCSICLGVIGTHNNVTTKCGHNFCLSCLLKHLEDNNHCPLCRDIIEKKRPRILKKITLHDTCKYIEEILDNYDISLVLYMIKNIPRDSYMNLTVHIRTIMTDLIRKLVLFQYKLDEEEEEEEDEEEEEEEEEEEDDEA